MIRLLLIALLLSVGSGCLKESIPPCSCKQGGWDYDNYTFVLCSGADNEFTLQKSLSRVRGEHVQELYIFHSSLVYLPSDIFDGIDIEYLRLVNDTFVSLSDADVAFKGLEHSLRTLRIEDCSFFSGWSWPHLRNLSSLYEITTENIGLEAIEEDIADIAHQNVGILQLTRDSVSFIHDRVFADFENLEILSLKWNLISDITRSMLPNPAMKIKELNFAFNKLETLPSDIFTEMPKLNTIILAGNNLLFLDEKTMSPVWKQLRKFDLLENPLRCDCRMKWILKVDYPPEAWAKCEKPPNLKGKYLDWLSPDELWC